MSDPSQYGYHLDGKSDEVGETAHNLNGHHLVEQNDFLASLLCAFALAVQVFVRAENDGRHLDCVAAHSPELTVAYTQFRSAQTERVSVLTHFYGYIERERSGH